MGKPDLFIKGSACIERLLKPLFQFLYDRGITANWLTFSQFLLWPVMLYLFSERQITAAMAVVLVTLFVDIVDGPFARATKTASNFGYLADKITDLGGIVVFLTGLILAFPGSTRLFGALIVASIVLYILNVRTDTEIWGGTRIFGPGGYFINQLTLGIQVSLAICVLVIIYNIGLLIKRKL